MAHLMRVRGRARRAHAASARRWLISAVLLSGGTASGQNLSATFGPATVIPAADFPRSVAAADLTGDGVADAAVSLESVGVVIYHNDGAGQLHVAQTIPFAFNSLQGARTVVSGDLNGDGATDLIFVRRDAGAATYSLFLLFNQGDGRFAPPEFLDEYGACATGKSDGLLRGSDFIALADVNGDGHPDILAPANIDLRVYLNDGAGRFGRPGLEPVADGCVSLVTSDLDHDGDPDLLMTDRAFRDIGVVAEINDGAGHFTIAPLFDLSSLEIGLGAADLDGDDDQDILVGGFFPDVLAIARNDGATFTVADDMPLASRPERVLSDDFNADGFPDAAVATDENVAVLLGRGDGTLAPALRAGDGARDLRTADMTGDGRPDLVYLRDDALVILPNTTPAACPGDLDGDRAVTLADVALLLSEFGTSGGADPAPGDLDVDGDVDLSDLATLLGRFGAGCRP